MPGACYCHQCLRTKAAGRSFTDERIAAWKAQRRAEARYCELHPAEVPAHLYDAALDAIDLALGALGVSMPALRFMRRADPDETPDLVADAPILGQYGSDGTVWVRADAAVDAAEVARTVGHELAHHAQLGGLESMRGHWHEVDVEDNAEAFGDAVLDELRKERRRKADLAADLAVEHARATARYHRATTPRDRKRWAATANALAEQRERLGRLPAAL